MIFRGFHCRKHTEMAFTFWRAPERSVHSLSVSVLPLPLLDNDPADGAVVCLPACLPASIQLCHHAADVLIQVARPSLSLSLDWSRNQRLEVYLLLYFVSDLNVCRPLFGAVLSPSSTRAALRFEHNSEPAVTTFRPHTQSS
jgi:hypothetical protein